MKENQWIATVCGAISQKNYTGGTNMRRIRIAQLWWMAMIGLAVVMGCTQETQNQLGRSIQNWTGTNGVLDVYAGDKLVKRFIKVEKLSTAYGTQDKMPRSYRFGYGYLDENMNLKVDPGEKKVYFEFSDFSTPYIFYENPDHG